MNRLIVGIPVVLALGALASTASADVVPAGASAVPAATAAAPALAQNQSNAVPHSAGTGPSTATSPAQPLKMICLDVSLQCFRVVAGAPGTTPLKPLDLRAPDIRSLVSEAELRRRTEDEWAIRERETEEVQQVKVEASRPDVYVPGGLASLPWAVRNPTQAWRIFLPVPSAK